jgi:hypothetical protein
MNTEDATKIFIHFMRNSSSGRVSNYGYDIYVPTLVNRHLESESIKPQEIDRKLCEYMPDFYAAAWELCRRGIIRPGVNEYGAQATSEGSAGNGYSITPFGKCWLKEAEHDDYVPTEPGRFAEMLAPYRQQFGPGFYERAQEAIRCYGAHAYLSCCVMCGAATESIVLAAAVKKKGEEYTLRTYTQSNGRSKIENLIIGQANEYIRREYLGYSSLLKYWRDISAHGKCSNISENEAYTSIAILLRFTAFMSDNWEDLTRNVIEEAKADL